MPGSEGGDRVRNFFDQEKFSHQHLQPQVVDGGRLVSSSFRWPGNQRHESSPLNFSPGNAASADRGYSDRQSSVVHSTPYLQSPQRPAFIANPHLMQHPSLNGYIHDHHPVQAKHDETDFMGMTRESNQHNLFLKGLLNSGAQFRNVPEQHQDARLEATESPINFEFFGSHQQMNSQQLGMLQTSPSQHSGLNDRQLLQQQAMVRNLYDVQRQQPLQKQGIRQLNSVNDLSIGQQMPNDRSSSNNTSFQDGSNYARMSQHKAGNSNWPLKVVTPDMHGISNGISFSAEESAPSHIFGFSPQSVDQSFYGFPISNTRSPSSHHSHSMEKPRPSSQQVSTESIPAPANQYGTRTLPSHTGVQDREFGSRYRFQKNNNNKDASSQFSYPGDITGNLQQVESQQRNPSMEFLQSQGPSTSSSSMNSKENTLSQIGILQDAAPLDPTEEQFLFGSDDNIWDAFGKSSDSKLEYYKMAEGSDLQNRFPSMQSGSWTALMQSALAETCGGDVGDQEEWSGLNHNGKPGSAAHEPLVFHSSEKQRTSVNNGKLLIKPSLDMNHYMPLEKTRAANSHSLQEFPLSSLSAPFAVNESLQFNSASKSSQQVSEGDRSLEFSNLKVHPEENQIRIESDHHLAPTLNLKDASSACAWDPQHETSLNTIGNQANNKSTDDTYMGSVPGNRSAVRSTSNENIMHPRYDEQKRFMHEEMQNKLAWSRNSFSNAHSLIGQVNSNSPTINCLQDNLNGSQNPTVSHDYNHGKHVGSLPKVGSENVARFQHPPAASPQVFDSSFSSHDKKFKQQARFWDNTSGNRLQDTFMSGQSYPSVADMKQKVSNQVAGSSPDIRNRYHPSGQEPLSSTQNDKGKGSNSGTDMHKLHDTSSVELPTNHLADKTCQSSQNMTELLNKAGQSTENSAEASRNSSDLNTLSEMRAEESLDTSMSHLQRNHSSGSHTYGLQLGLLHQRFPTQICDPSQASSSLGLNSSRFALHHPPAVSQAELHDSRLGGSVSSHKVQEHCNASPSPGPPNLGNQLQNQSREGHRSNNPFMPVDSVVSHVDHTDNFLAKASIMPSSGGTHFNTQGIDRHFAHLPSSSYQADKSIQSNVNCKELGLPSAWTNVPNLKGSSQPDIFASQSHMTASVIPVKKDEINLTITGNDFPGSGALNTVLSSKSLGEAPRTIDNYRKSGVPEGTGLEVTEVNVRGKDGFLFSDTVTHANPENSGHLKFDGKPQNSYSLLDQLRVMRSTETDPKNRDSKRLKVQSSSSNSQKLPSRFGAFGQHQSSYSPSASEIENSNSAASGDSKLGSVPSINQGRYLPLHHADTSFQNTPTFGQNGGPSMSSSVHSQINPQKAPNWFERYASLNREQLVSASDNWKHSLSRPLELGQTPYNSSSSFLSKNHVAELPALSFTNEVGDMKICSALEQTNIEQSVSPPPEALTSSSLVSVLPNKLKTATLELFPWYKEVEWHGLLDLPSISSCERKWANATKRNPEKVMDEVEQTDNRTVKCKRRLVLTTQLMQQLFDPPTTSVMSSDASMNFESMIYFTSRISCGSACSVSGSKNYRTMSPDQNNVLYEKVLEKGNDLLSKVENDFLFRASKLENMLSSLEKQTSILDLQIECQDLEKFSVINRFARFHGRGQADGPAVMSSQSHGPQRYVTALPSPRNLPDTAQCLSL